jgi:protocatechuate 3,4-dioxygenase beta subunit
MTPPNLPTNRRHFLSAAALGMAYFTTRGLFAEELDRVRTPAQTEGPFYPNKLPLDTDNDLIIVNEGITPAVGQITHLSGKVLDIKGRPMRNALVESGSATATACTFTPATPTPRTKNATRTFRALAAF